jgi:hypothetical protein
VSAQAAERFVDVVLQDGWLNDPIDLLSAFRSPAGRNPAPSSLAVAEALSGIEDAQALPIIKAALDAAYFSVFNLLDSGMKNSGVRVRIDCDAGRWVSDEPTAGLHDIYRDRVGPNGSVRKPS